MFRGLLRISPSWHFAYIKVCLMEFSEQWVTTLQTNWLKLKQFRTKWKEQEQRLEVLGPKYRWLIYLSELWWLLNEYRRKPTEHPWERESRCWEYGKGQWSWWIGGYAGFTRSFWLRAKQGPDGSGTLHVTIRRLFPYSTHLGREIINVLREHW